MKVKNNGIADYNFIALSRVREAARLSKVVKGYQVCSLPDYYAKNRK